MIDIETAISRFEVLVKDWNIYIFSDQGVFSTINSDKRIIAGPRLVSEGRVTGDMLVIETNLFMTRSTPEQKAFYNFLERTESIKARQYLLVMVGGYDIWKRDLSILKEFYNKWKEGKKLLEEEKDDLTKDDIDRLNRLKELIGSSLGMQDIEKIIADMLDSINIINKEEETLQRFMNNLKNHIELIEKNFPFLK
jgi:hypothetical protein